MTHNFFYVLGLWLAIGFNHDVLAQGSPRYWSREWTYPLAPCAGPLADREAPYRYISAYGHARACTDYDEGGKARAVLRYFSNHSQQWLPDISLDAPAGLSGLEPQGIRLLTTADHENTEILVFALEYGPDHTQTTQIHACRAPARYEEVRAYAFSQKQGLKVGGQTPGTCLAEVQPSDTWARFGRGYSEAGGLFLITGHGPEPQAERLNFSVDKDGDIFRTFPFSL